MFTTCSVTPSGQKKSVHTAVKITAMLHLKCFWVNCKTQGKVSSGHKSLSSLCNNFKGPVFALTGSLWKRTRDLYLWASEWSNFRPLEFKWQHSHLPKETKLKDSTLHNQTTLNMVGHVCQVIPLRCKVAFGLSRTALGTLYTLKTWSHLSGAHGDLRLNITC